MIISISDIYQKVWSCDLGLYDVWQFKKVGDIKVILYSNLILMKMNERITDS